MVTVSVVIPVYNIEAHLRQCLDSVVAQTLSDLEIICVNDGSTDTSLQILSEYAAQDDRIQIVTQANAGPGSARNIGLKLSTGKFLIFLDSDDWFEPNFLELMVKRAEKSEADVTICRAVEFDTNTKVELPSSWMLKMQYLPNKLFSPGEVSLRLFQFTYGWPWDKLYRTDFIQQKKLCFPSLPNSEDVVYVFSSLAAANRIAVVDHVLVHHRINRKLSVSNSRHLNPNAPYCAVQLLEKDLRNRNLYSQYKQSFLCWALEFLLWNVCNAENTVVCKTLFHAFREDWMYALDFKKCPVSYCKNGFVYCKYLLLRYAPWPVFSFVLWGYHAAKRLKEGR